MTDSSDEFKEAIKTAVEGVASFREALNDHNKNTSRQFDTVATTLQEIINHQLESRVMLTTSIDHIKTDVGEIKLNVREQAKDIAGLEATGNGLIEHNKTQDSKLDDVSKRLTQIKASRIPEKLHEQFLQSTPIQWALGIVIILVVIGLFRGVGVDPTVGIAPIIEKAAKK